MIGLKILPGLAYFSKNMNVWFIDISYMVNFSPNNNMASVFCSYSDRYVEFSYRDSTRCGSLPYYTYIHRFYLDNCYR